jgi:hypothetical protein
MVSLAGPRSEEVPDTLVPLYLDRLFGWLAPSELGQSPMIDVAIVEEWRCLPERNF